VAVESANQDLINPDLFGNDAGEDELPEVLNGYFLEKQEFHAFFNADTRLAFVRSRKGIGKSALLRQVYFRRSNLNEGELLIYVKASDLVAMQEVDTSSPTSVTVGAATTTLTAPRPARDPGRTRHL
jgi:hypothetical protein